MGGCFSAEDDSRGPLRIIIAGPPAAGKGTQCERIIADYGVVHISTGDLLRDNVNRGTDLGKTANEFMEKGELVPDDVIIGIVKEKLDSDDCKKKGWLLDGFPRTAVQAKALEEHGIVAEKFILIKVPDDVLVERVEGRRLDPETGKIYHIKFSPAEDDEVSKRLIQRSDDTAEKIKTRLSAYHSNVDAIFAFYESFALTVDGNQDKEAVYSTVKTYLEARKVPPKEETSAAAPEAPAAQPEAPAAASPAPAPAQ